MISDNDYFYSVLTLFYRANPMPFNKKFIYKDTLHKKNVKTGYVNSFDVEMSNVVSSQILFKERYQIVVYTEDDLEDCPLNIVLHNW